MWILVALTHAGSLLQLKLLYKGSLPNGRRRPVHEIAAGLAPSFLKKNGDAAEDDILYKAQHGEM